MDKLSVDFTVTFDGQFYVGVCTKRADDKLFAYKIVFGAEPRDGEVLEFVKTKWYEMRFGSIEADEVKSERKNPKARSREIRRVVASNRAIGTKAMQAVKKQVEDRKAERKDAARERRAAEADEKFRLRQEKKREKHKGR